MAEHAPVLLYAEFEALPEHLDAVRSLVEALVQDVRAEPGNVLFLAHQERTAPTRFFVYEQYRDEDAFQAHLSMAHGQAFNRALGPLVVGGASRVTFLHAVEGPVVIVSS